MAISFVRFNYSAPNTGSSSTLSATLTAAPTVGNLMVLATRCGSGASVTAVGDNAGNTWTLDSRSTATGTTNASIWSAPVYSVPTVASVTYSAATANRSTVIYEFSGVSLLNNRVAATGASVSTTNTTSLTYSGFAPTQINQLVFAAIGVSAIQVLFGNGGGTPIGSTFNPGANSAIASSYWVQPNTTPTNWPFSWITSANSAMAMVAYRPADPGAFFETLGT